MIFLDRSSDDFVLIYEEIGFVRVGINILLLQWGLSVVRDSSVMPEDRDDNGRRSCNA